METTNLEELRKNLSLLDQDIARMLERRVDLAKQVWIAKKETGIEEAFVPERENLVFQNLRSLKLQNLSPEDLESVFLEIVSVCRSAQSETHVTILGEKYGWINDAALTRFGSTTNLDAAENFDDFIIEITKSPGNLGFASFSPHNSIEYLHLVEALFSGKLNIIEEFNFSPEFSVVSNTARDLSEVHELCVTSEMLQLLRHFFISLSYDLKIKICRSTSEAFENLQSINPIAAIIPSRLVGTCKDLRVIKSELKSDSTGTIKFLTLSAKPHISIQSGLKTTLLCAINQPGPKIFEILSILNQNKFKVCDIHTVKFSGKPWDTILIIDIILHEGSERFPSVVKELEAKCLLVKVCGFYTVFR